MHYKIWLLVVLKVVNGQNPIIHLEDGTIRGTINKTEGRGLIYHAFRGIPYAAPPVENLRFRPPHPPAKWSGVLDATEDGPQCLQNIDLVHHAGQEDCLTINVYSSAISCSTNIPTMVWIHGGAFIGGNSSYKIFGPDYLLDNCVCFVSFNYRVGIFGFLSTGDAAALGNYGLKDQRFALQWVQKNIEKFGCDKSNVLLFGESAGAASVSILSQVESTRGLFHKAIMESGTSLCVWTRARQARKLAFSIGRQLGIETTNSTTLVQSLRNKTAVHIQEAMFQKWLPWISKDPVKNIIGVGPVIEPQLTESILTTQSYETLSGGYSHKIPMIIGFTSNEAAFIDIFPFSLLLKLYGFTYENFMKSLVPENMNISDFIRRSIATIRITQKYFGTIPLLDLKAYSNFIKYLTDSMFVKPIITTAQLQSKFSKVYLYRFSYLSRWASNVKKRVEGVGHGAEMSYIFRRYQNFNITACESQIREIICTLWTNMAYTGNPTLGPDHFQLAIKWSSVNSSNVELLDINKSSTMLINPYADVLNFWNDLYKKYGVRPFDTY